MMDRVSQLPRGMVTLSIEPWPTHNPTNWATRDVSLSSVKVADETSTSDKTDFMAQTVPPAPWIWSIDSTSPKRIEEPLLHVCLG